jgi:hypothetical protein
MYYETINPGGQKVIILLENNMIISMTENSDSFYYKRYLEWLSEGNQPEPWNN